MPDVRATLVAEARQALWAFKGSWYPDQVRRALVATRGITLPRLPRRGRIAGSVWAVTMVRDECDVLDLALDNLLEQGVDHIIVSDNLSADGTLERLQDRARRDPRVHLAIDREPAYHQAEKMTRLARAAGRAGADWIIPFDADELWFAEGRSLKDFLGGLDPAVTVVDARFHHMVPERSARTPRDLRESTFVLDATPVKPGKVAFRSHHLARVGIGNHAVARVGERSEGLHIAHALYRSPQQIARKVRQGSAAVRLTNPTDNLARHWRRGESLDDDTVTEVWENISQGRPDLRLNYRAFGPMVRVQAGAWRTWDPHGEVPFRQSAVHEL